MPLIIPANAALLAWAALRTRTSFIGPRRAAPRSSSALHDRLARHLEGHVRARNLTQAKPFEGKSLQVVPYKEPPMRIAQIAPLSEAVPPRLYGGTERVVSWLTEELVRLGHEVTLFASGNSQTTAELVACARRGCASRASATIPRAISSC